MSTITKQGLEELYERITEMFNLDNINLDNDILITNIRHKDLITQTIKCVEKTKNTLEQNMPLDIVSICIKEILEGLGRITGEEVTEDIINEIFSRFCLGK